MTDAKINLKLVIVVKYINVEFSNEVMAVIEIEKIRMYFL